MTERFNLTDEHVKLLRRANVCWESEAYEGAPCIDVKRPYGNSQGVARDIADILDWPLFKDAHGEEHLSAEQAARGLALHRETETALTIILAFGTFTPGTYERADSWMPWKPVPPKDTP